MKTFKRGASYRIGRQLAQKTGMVILSREFLSAHNFIAPVQTRIADRQTSILLQQPDQLITDRKGILQKFIDEPAYKISPLKPGMRKTVDFLKTGTYGIN